MRISQVKMIRLLYKPLRILQLAFSCDKGRAGACGCPKKSGRRDHRHAAQICR